MILIFKVATVIGQKERPYEDRDRVACRWCRDDRTASREVILIVDNVDDAGTLFEWLTGLCENKPDAVTAFENLRKVVGDVWDGVDPEEYVREIRHD